MLGTMTSGYAVVQFLFAPLWGQLPIGKETGINDRHYRHGRRLLLYGPGEKFLGPIRRRVLGGFLSSATLPAQAMAAELSGHETVPRPWGLWARPSARALSSDH